MEHQPHMNSRDWFGETPLHEASRNTADGDRIIKTLVQHGAKINEIDNDGNTALHRAGYVQNSKAFKALLTAEADSSIQNIFGERALDDSRKWAGVFTNHVRVDRIREAQVN
jgi:ankyrin repeat protein